MPSYTVTIATGDQWFAGTDDYIYITLVGTEHCSERTLLDKPLYNDFERGAVDSYDVRVGEDLGGIVLVKLQKKKFWVYDDWYCRYVTVKTPAGDYVEFPCFRWLVDDNEVEWQPGFLMSINANRHNDLPRDIQFDSEKGVDFVLNYSKAYVL
ncbi:unnamed protein product [Tetraodon nigroviridis]|uniref:(spotted green pufferfish) hypothetical protein n=1 Tax=Tetraodon nigroviridis TaxID=99883 RepID=Q4SKY4_TETNG|nr:unnamed protein product [Tetraodon nigroviridis]